MKIKYLVFNIAISLTITMLPTYFLLSQIDYLKVISLFAEINYTYIIISFIFYFLLILVRALRIKLLARSDTSIKNLFAIVMMNNFFINLLPMRTGEISLPILLNKYAGIEKKNGFMMLFYLRSLDFFVVLMFLFVAVLFFSSDILEIYNVSSFAIIVLAAIILSTLFAGEKALFFLRNIFAKINRLKFLARSSGTIDKLLSSYKFYKSKFAVVFILSIAIFLLLIFVLGFALKAYSIGLDYSEVVSVSLIIIMIMSLPINGIAGIGTIELGISAFLISTGIAKNLAISVAFNYHFISLLFIIFCGGLSYLYLSFKGSDC